MNICMRAIEWQNESGAFYSLNEFFIIYILCDSPLRAFSLATLFLFLFLSLLDPFRSHHWNW